MNRNLMRQAQELQNRLAKLQEELGKMTVEATAGGGAVKVVATGHQKIVSIAVAKEAVNPEDVEMLQDLVLAAVNEALDKSRDLAAKHLGQLTGGMKIPGLM
ncbi:MAG: YbaB/EbfC family nucleoid-associated protein [Dehalococcoidia bacterium]|nr:YbaB/EbfC family nucleoid-associated protein [Dehalococcoidia bacterium]